VAVFDRQGFVFRAGFATHLLSFGEGFPTHFLFFTKELALSEGVLPCTEAFPSQLLAFLEFVLAVELSFPEGVAPFPQPRLARFSLFTSCFLLRLHGLLGGGARRRALQRGVRRTSPGRGYAGKRRRDCGANA